MQSTSQKEAIASELDAKISQREIANPRDLRVYLKDLLAKAEESPLSCPGAFYRLRAALRRVHIFRR